MTKEEIKKALECCILVDGNSCKTCPYLFYENCKSGAVAVQDELNLITEQEKEIERLNSHNGFLQSVISHSKDMLDEAVKEAQIYVLNKLKKRARTSYVLDDFILGSVVFSKDIDELIKEVQNAENKG